MASNDAGKSRRQRGGGWLLCLERRVTWYRVRTMVQLWDAPGSRQLPRSRRDAAGPLLLANFTLVDACQVRNGACVLRQQWSVGTSFSSRFVSPLR